MLINLKIRDFAIIDELEVDFGAGLNVMTGETGAGKTILIEALKLVVGSRALVDCIRSGKERAEISAIFDAKKIPGHLKQILDDAQISCDDTLIIHRTVSGGGKSKATVNGIPVTASWLSIFTEHLVDISGQHEHQILLDPKRHAHILDSFGGFHNLVDDYSDAHRRWTALSNEIKDLEANEKTQKEKLEFLTFQLEEIETADLQTGEDVRIETERSKQKHAAVLTEKITNACSAVYSGDQSALAQVDAAISLIVQCAGFDGGLSKFSESLGRARAELEDTGRELSRYIDGLESDPARLEELEERLHLIRSLLKKHGGSIEACLEKKEKLKKEINSIVGYDDILAEKKETLNGLNKTRQKAAAKLSSMRVKAALKLSSLIAEELAGLAMGKIQFVADVRNLSEEEWDEDGPNHIEFLISPNVGEPLMPLVRIASGGELSRVMLAIKGVLSSQADESRVSVFDEVDSGIGGATAAVVGRKLKELAKTRQVICITHLPQVAVFGDTHFNISKHVKKGRTVTFVEKLDKDERVNEVARMLASEKITDATVVHAKEMLKSCR